MFVGMQQQNNGRTPQATDNGARVIYVAAGGR